MRNRLIQVNQSICGAVFPAMPVARPVRLKSVMPKPGPFEWKKGVTRFSRQPSKESFRRCLPGVFVPTARMNSLPKRSIT